MHFKVKKYIVRVILAAIIITAVATVPSSAQTSAANQDEKTKLQQDLTDIENQIAAYQRELGEIKGQKNTLQNKIKQLQKQQAALNLQIKSTALQIADLGRDITKTEDAISVNTAKAREIKKKLAEFIALAYEQDDTPLLHIVLSHDNLSDMLSELLYYSEVSEKLTSLLKEAKALNEQLAADKIRLESEQDESRNLLSIQSLERGQLAASVNEHGTLLDQTRGLESEYQTVLGSSQKQAAEIRTRLYQLLGVSTQITFGEAVEIAKWASAQTGVRPAFLLAILTQESNLGKNVGTCNRPADPPEKSYRAVMKPDRDIAPFLEITSELGMDPEITPVSCPMKGSRGKQIGWGGAMGPAQFIPSTWLGYKDRVSAVTGKLASPWDIRDAFLASAIKLQGAGARSVEGEWAAAMRYFSGGTNVRYRFYGDNVIKTANQYQTDIDAIAK